MAFDYAGAKAAGYTDQEIQAYLDQKKNKKGVAEKVADFVVPATKKFVGAVSSSFGQKAKNKANENLQEQMNIRQRSLVDEAQTTQDPLRRKENLRMAKQTTGEMMGARNEFSQQAKQTQEDIGYREGESNLGYALKTGGAVGAEVGTWLAPAGKGVKGAIGMGALEGALTSLSDIEGGQDVSSALGSAVTGALFSGSMSVLGKGTKKVWKAITQNIPKASLANKLGVISTKQLKYVDDLLEEGSPGSYKKMTKWLRDLGENAEKELQKLNVDKGFTTQDLFGTDDPKIIKKAMIEAKDLATELRTKNLIKPKSRSPFKAADADELFGTLGNLALGEPVSFQEALNMKRAFQVGYNPNLTDAGNTTKVLRKNISDQILASIKNSSDEAKKLLNTEQLSVVMGKLSEAASVKTFKNALPSILEISALMATGYGVATGNEGMTLGSGGAFLLSRGLADPRGARELYKAGKLTQKVGNKLDNKTVEKVRGFLSKGATREVSKVGK